ncbi:response regulator transcription factor [Chryseobacterium oryctis]|uniref:Response regulator transcription factor n=1 Tax=Chryseobacterium oryctis TaxID=2952618 RepID=A0ABT3HME9_9FLAO|nr:response regulator transcription factor [Chryseobacterium oryctis]MCW3160965.1 response regulator transcription factor [Chryseobacterium oryctis]
MKILIVEDEPEIREVVKHFLEEEHFIVEYAEDYQSGLDKVISYDYDCILLDVMLPDGNGIDLLREIKNMQKKDPVIILSAKDSVDDKVNGLEIGADDYLAKPFHLAELMARIKSVLRRKNQDGENILKYKNISIDPEARIVQINNKEISLNRKEYDLLYYFMINPGKTLQKTMLAEAIWGDYIDQADSLDFIYSQIKNLRKKLKTHSSEADFHAVYGIGYKFI